MKQKQMETLTEKIKRIFELMGFWDVSVTLDNEGRRVSVILGDEERIKEFIPELVNQFKYLINIIARKEGAESYVVDINNYRKERERLITELAKAAAQKAATTKGEIKLPAMNAYERRLVHVELSMRPDVKTESIGEGKERYVIVKPL